MVVCKKAVSKKASQIVDYSGQHLAQLAILMHACDQHKLVSQIFIFGLVHFLHVRFLFSFFKAFR